MWPPPLLRTAVRMFSGTLLICAQQFLDRKLLEVGVAFESLVEIGDVCGVVLVVMDLHRLRVDVRFECVERIRERRQCVSSFEERLLVRKWNSFVPPEIFVLPHNYTRLAGNREISPSDFRQSS